MVTSLPQKSSLSGGAFGYPDANYITNVNAALDRLRVPQADACLGLNNVNSHDVRNDEVVHYSAPLSVDGARPLPGALVQVSVDTKPSPVTAMIPVTPPATLSSSIASSMSSTSSTYWAPPVTAPMPSAPPPTTADAFCSSASSLPMEVNASADGDCPICFDALSQQPSVQIKACLHAFHEGCAMDSLNHEPKCPVCRTQICEPQGKSPSGTMTIKRLRNVPCPGLASASSTLEITYTIPSGAQLSYHEHPGHRYGGTTRQAYVPDNIEGCRLLTRLKYAWNRGLIFRVGTSLTTGQRNTVTWTSIHHKTSLQGGPHGYPDPNYIANCNLSLDALGVPDADSCIQKPQTVWIT